MANKKTYSKEFKLEMLRRHEEEGISFYKLEKENNLSLGMIRNWKAIYEVYGEDGLSKQNCMLCQYTAEFKEKVVREYLTGTVSYRKLAQKYGIFADSTIKKWVELYNSHEELTDSRPKGGFLMAKDNTPRKTTMEERIAIVEDCISNGNNYGQTAQKYNCSYGQVYSWVRKYKEKGVDGLADCRGKRKQEDQLSELEQLRAEVRMLKAEKKQQQMEIDLLKKLEDIERRCRLKGQDI